MLNKFYSEQYTNFDISKLIFHEGSLMIVRDGKIFLFVGGKRNTLLNPIQKALIVRLL